MKALKIEANADTPKVYLDPELDLYLIEGKSLPENAIDFYVPILDWLSEFCNNKEDQSKNFVFNIRLDYFNTASSKQIGLFFKIISNSSINDRIKIVWHYDEEDECMLRAGERYHKLLGLNFEYAPYGY